MSNSFTLTALRKRAGLIASIAAILSLTLLATISRPVDASKSIVTVFADNQERTISTAVTTVGEALERANVTLTDNDLVEPSIDTVINQNVFRINVYRARPVTVVDENGKTATIMSPYTSPRLIAEGAGFTVYDEDIFKFELIDDILATGTVGQRLVIERSNSVAINLYGDQIVQRTHASTVGEVLAEAGVEITEDDEVTPNLTAQLTDDQKIKIVRVGTDVIVEEEPIAFSTEIIYDANKFVGEKEVTTAGSDGIRVVTYELALENGEEIARKELQSVDKKDPVDEVKVVGTKVRPLPTVTGDKYTWLAASGIPEDQWQYVDFIVMRESGWNPLAVNPSSGACGLAQALPCSKVGAGATDPVAALQWQYQYVNARYGGYAGAYDFWVVNHWY